MFRKAIVQGVLPSQADLVRLEGLKNSSVRQETAPGCTEEDLDDLVVDLDLQVSGKIVVFDGLEQTSYIGTARNRLVFAIHIGDDVPGWLGEIFGVDAEAAQEAGTFPVTGEAVYLFAPIAPAEHCNMLLGMWCGDPQIWNPEATWPMAESDLAPLMDLAGL